jgi:Iap family predicted aminopeptidase
MKASGSRVALVGISACFSMAGWLAGCQEASPPIVQGEISVEAFIEAIQAEVTVEALDEALDSIVQYDRLSGSSGEFAAVEYLRRTLEADGISTRVDTFLAYISDPVSASVSIPETGFSPEAITISGSASVTNLEGTLVDLGSLADLPPYLTETGERLILEARGPAGSMATGAVPEEAGRDPAVPARATPDLTGRIALVTGQPRPGPVVQITELGAAGVIFVNPEERLNDLTTTSVWGAPSLRNFHRIPTLPVAEIKRSAGNELRSRMAQGPVEVSMSTETRTGWKELRLLIASVQGPNEDAPFILAGGHLDSWHFGGTDNAGANVAMLALARALHRHKDQLRRGVAVAWWPGHSNGRYAGSTWFADTQFDALRRHAAAHVNFEGLGQIEAKRFSANASASLSELAIRVVEDEVGDRVRPTPPGRNSDQSFNGVGLPLLQLNHARLAEDGGYWWWHTPDDTRDKVDAGVLKVDTDLYAAALGHLLAAPALPVALSPVVERLDEALREAEAEARGHLELDEAIDRNRALLRTVRELEEEIPAATNPNEDRAIVAILRPLHRVLYTHLGPYHPDPAVTQGTLPGLNPVAMLVENDPTTDRHQFALTTLRRELARVLEAIDLAQERADRMLENTLPHSPTENGGFTGTG